MARVVSSVFSMLWLLLAPPLLAGGPVADGPSRDPAQEQVLPSDVKGQEAERADTLEKIAKVRERRDAALVRANVYVLPQDRVAAEEAQAELDRLEAKVRELDAALEKAGRKRK